MVTKTNVTGNFKIETSENGIDLSISIKECKEGEGNTPGSHDKFDDARAVLKDVEKMAEQYKQVLDFVKSYTGKAQRSE